MKKILLVFLAALLLTSCAQKNGYEKHSFFSMDTFAEVRSYSKVDDTIATLKSAQRVSDSIEGSVSKTLETSFTHRLNTVSDGNIQTDEWFTELLDMSVKLSEITDGYFNPLSGDLVELWEKCEREQRIPVQDELTERIVNIENTQIQIGGQFSITKKGDAKLDFGAVGKGYAADKMVDELKNNGVDVGMVTFVSTVSVFGERDFKIAIRTPDTSGETAGYITMRNQALSVSGDYERFYTINGKNYTHIIDPHSGLPVSNGIHSVVVVCESAAVADALSTAIFAMGIEKSTELYSSGKVEFEALIITDEHIVVTPRMAEKFELVSDRYKLAEN